MGELFSFSDTSWLTSSDGQHKLLFDLTANNTHLDLLEANSIRCLTGAPLTERLRITAEGNVGIGTTTIFNPEGCNGVVDVVGTSHARLNVRSSGGVVAGVFSHDDWVGPRAVIGTESNHPLTLATNYTHRLTISPDGNVGIGTTSIYNPQGWNRVVDVVGTSHARLNVRSSGGVVAGVFSHDDWAGPRAVIGTESNHPLTLATNYTHRLTISPDGNVGIGTTSIYNPQGWNRVVDVVGTSHARLNVRSSGGVVAGVFSHDDWAGPRAVIGTESNHPLTLATNYTHRLTISPDGNVGIGTTSIYNPQGWNRVVDVVGTSHARLNVRSSGGVVAGVFSHDDWVGPRAVIGTESNHPLTLATNYTHRLTISPDGNVGIGTTSIYNPQGWNRVVDVVGTSHARLNVRSSGGVVAGVFSHDDWAGPRAVIGTESNHPLTLATNYTHRLTIS